MVTFSVLFHEGGEGVGEKGRGDEKEVESAQADEDEGEEGLDPQKDEDAETVRNHAKPP